MSSQLFHLIGIGGVGMNAVAKLCLMAGFRISGSDVQEGKSLGELRALGAEVFVGHREENIQLGMTVVYSTAIKEDNPERKAALRLGLPLWHRSELLSLLCKGRYCLAIAGTHGKTTTSCLLAHVLRDAGLDPSFAIGGVAKNLGSNAHLGESKYFVIEADESDGSFLNYEPDAAILTHVEEEHLDHWQDGEKLVEGFSQFVAKVRDKERIFYSEKGIPFKGVSYGVSPASDLVASRLMHMSCRTLFDVEFKGEKYLEVSLGVTGDHNVFNALAVFGLARALGISEETIRGAFARFSGVQRRADLIGEERNILIFDDYAHHPTEIAAALQGLRQMVGLRRLVVLYQPHRFSRTRDVMQGFSSCFKDADQVIVMDVYSAGEPSIAGIDGPAVARVAREGQKACRYVAREKVMNTLSDILAPHDVLVTMGAGDVSGITKEMRERLREELPMPLKVGVLFGGRSWEHEISIVSARTVCETLYSEEYIVKQFGVTTRGQWISGPDVTEFLSVHEQMQDEDVRETLTPEILQELLECDVFLPIFHGSFGEDGMIQGFLETLRIAYVGCDYRSAAICTDKVRAKQVVASYGIPTPPYVHFSVFDWKSHKEEMLRRIYSEICEPCFVKPRRGGSSLGVTKVDDLVDVEEAIERAFTVDTDVVVEESIYGRELEFAPIGNVNIHVPPPAEVFSQGQLYDYEAKYGEGGIRTAVQADLPPEITRAGQELAVQVYQVVGATGMASVEFILDSRGVYWFTEMNSTPGFTDTSLFSKMWEANGLDNKRLLQELMVFAMARKRWQDSTFHRPQSGHPFDSRAGLE